MLWFREDISSRLKLPRWADSIIDKSSDQSRMDHAEFKTGLAAASELALNGIEDFEGSKQSKGSR